MMAQPLIPTSQCVEHGFAIVTMFLPPINGYPSFFVLVLCVAFMLATLFSYTACDCGDTGADIHNCSGSMDSDDDDYDYEEEPWKDIWREVTEEETDMENAYRLHRNNCMKDYLQ
ncbi:hypothetical protein EDC01DRAFT_727811 [Geopyxis carbonaria]|nr:hypothetical protein EDC01DRAFT_727811 [Geopyxis carbonaria]